MADPKGAKAAAPKSALVPAAPVSAQQMLAYWQDEMDGVALYSALAAAEETPKMADFYRRMAAVEQRHADKWAAALAGAGIAHPAYKTSWRTRTLIWLAGRLGPAAVLPTIVSQEQTGSRTYDGVPGEEALAADERSHAFLLKQAAQGTSGGLEGGTIATLEGRHRAGGGNALRAAVLGANDGLVSNLSLVMGVAGASMSANSILVTGLAGLLAGACSMALGEWLSVQSSRELYERQIGVERQEIAISPAEEAEELALIYEARGLPPEQARQTADRILSDKNSALETLAREELGIDPGELGGSAWEAAITSFVLFAIGAIIPVLAFFFLEGTAAVVVSVALSTVGLFAIGAGITLFTGRSVAYSGARQVGFGLAAAALTYGIGALIGVSLAG